MTKKQERDREYVKKKRAAMTPEQRAEARRQYDETYRNTHREQRRHSQKSHRRGEGGGRWDM